jgi:hypothetical protein
MRELNKKYRSLLKETGSKAKCDIEPDISTIIIDEFMKNEEVFVLLKF